MYKRPFPWSPRLDMSNPSILTDPAVGSRILKRARPRLDLPAPVRPTRPTFSPAWTSRLNPLRTGANSARYAVAYSVNSIWPCSGQL